MLPDVRIGGRRQRHRTAALPRLAARVHSAAMTVTLSESVAILEQLLGQGEYHLLRQREVIAELERDGLDTKHARDVLQALERSLSVHLFELERLRQEITTAVAQSVP